MARTPSPGPPQRGEPPSQRPFSVHLWRAPSVSHSSVPGSEISSVKPFSLTAEEEKGKKKEKKKLYFGQLPSLGHRMLQLWADSSKALLVFCPLCVLPSFSFSLSMCWPPSPLPPHSASHHVITPPMFNFSLPFSHLYTNLNCIRSLLLTLCGTCLYTRIHTHTRMSTTSWL